MTFEIIHKPTFTNQLLAIPKEQVVQILEKIEYLRDDPKPQGNLKKKLHGYQGSVYRLRSGDYRIVYTYGDGWVALLGVDARKDVYKGSKLVADTPDFDFNNLPDLKEVLSPTSLPTSKRSQKKKTEKDETLLPIAIAPDLLQNLKVPETYFTALSACRTLDDLIAADVPETIRERLFDCISTPNFDLVIAQPSFRTGGMDDLLRFREGDLLGFLLKLNPEQEKYVTWAVNAKGATLLKGSPGTGKSTVALYRLKAILDQIKGKGSVTPKILFATYTNALVTFSRQLLESLLGDDIQYVEVKTADAIAYSFVCQFTGQINIAKSIEQKQLLGQALNEAIPNLSGNKLQRHAQQQILQRLSLDYLLEEINNIIEGRDIKSLDEYQNTSRNGRSVSFNAIQRQAIWQLRQHFYKLLAQNNLETWQQLRTRALNILRQTNDIHRYDAVLIDEAQDLEPNALRLLVELCNAPNRLFMTADANQSIYGSSFRWSDVHQDLKFAGRTGILRTNHRTTKEIDIAAHSYLAEGILDDEISERDWVHSGPQPAVRAVNNTDDEAALVQRFCQTAAREFRLGIGSCAVLVSTEKAGKRIAQQLTTGGLAAHYMSSRELDLNKQGVKVLTLKAAKGLEFPIVVLAGFLDARFPTIPKGSLENAIAQGAAPKVIAEIQQRERRTVFVAMTRAMRALLVVVPAKNPSLLLQDFDERLWNLGMDEE
jgi:superfamily I DNA/RNA helicase/mRNA-degrading endonuclease RelE of RelBE toxin-antitoxin system